MNVNDYTYLLNNPSAINSINGMHLDKIIREFPFFQSARALRLKNLYIKDSFQYNQSLRTTAAYTTDRSVLFEFITSEDFSSLQKIFFDEKEAKIKEIIVNDSILIIDDNLEKPTEHQKRVIDDLENVLPYQSVKLEKSIRDLIPELPPEVYSDIEFVRKEAVIVAEEKTIEERLEINKPIAFSANEKHSFQEWLQLANFKPIIREENSLDDQTLYKEIDEIKQKKNDLIDRFIASNPKISPIKTYVPNGSQLVENEDNSSIMTETLAKVYLEQKKYQKAIQAYEILILKYPEKFSFFANRISDIKSLQQNNN